jgi:hypothetical protein
MIILRMAFCHSIRTLQGAVLLALMLPGIAGAELIVNAGIEYFYWKESTTPEVTETGPLGTIGLSWTQDVDSGVLFGYRGKVWWGSVAYEGSTLIGNTPLTGDTHYLGIDNEFQLRVRRTSIGGNRLDGVFGLGLDVWRRSLSSVQNEDWQVGYVRLGIESGAFDVGKWSVATGLKLPVWTREDAHLNDIGFDSNPQLSPGKDLSAYANLGYRIAQRWQMVAYYDSFRFKRSDEVQATLIGTGPQTLFQPPSKMDVIGLRFEYQLR